jgi:hypothetical protein
MAMKPGACRSLAAFSGVSTLVDGLSMAKGVDANSATFADVLRDGARETGGFGSAVCRRVGLEAGSISPPQGPRRPKARNVGGKATL